MSKGAATFTAVELYSQCNIEIEKERREITDKERDPREVEEMSDITHKHTRIHTQFLYRRTGVKGFNVAATIY